MIANNDKILLRKFRESDIDLKIKWINDKSNNKYLHYDIPLNKKDTTIWFKNKDDSKRLDLMIEYEKRPVGIVGLLNISKRDSKAEFYITVGDSQYKNRSIGFLSSVALLEYAFTKLYLNKVYLNVDADNVVAIKLYRKLGFKEEGYFIKDLFSESEEIFIDRIRMAIFKDEFLRNEEVL